MGVILLCLCAAGYMIWQVMDIYPEGYTAEQLGIEELYSMRDENGNGTDDYHDFVAGARAYVESGPLYQSIYYAGGYPDDEHGVCTDVIWHAFAHAGYTRKDMVEEDIAADPQAYGIEMAIPTSIFAGCAIFGCSSTVMRLRLIQAPKTRKRGSRGISSSMMSTSRCAAICAMPTASRSSSILTDGARVRPMS